MMVKELTTAATATLLAVALGLGAQPASAAARVTPAADDASVNVGESVTFSLFGADFESPLDGGGLDIRFPSSMLELTQVTIDPAWNFMPDTGAIDNVQGRLTALSFNAFPAVADESFKIASLIFTAKGPGTAVLELASNDFFVFGSGGAQVPVQFGSTAVNISAVPEPAAALLLLCGLAVLSYKSHRAIGS